MIRSRTSLILLFALLAGCNRGQGADIALPWEVEPLWSVGGQGSAGISLSELHPFQVDADPAHIYILDRSSRHLYRLDPDGQRIDTIGRSGAGPGEFVDPWSVATSPDGAVHVTDLGARRVTSWSANGERQPPRPLLAQLEGPALRFLRDEPVMLTFGNAPDGSREGRLRLGTVDSGPVLARITKPPRRQADLPSCQAMQISLTPLFTPMIVWDARGTHLAVNSKIDYLVDLHDGDRRVARIERRLKPLLVSEADALEAAANWKINDCLVPPAEVIRATTYRPTRPVIEALVIAPDSQLWVRRRGGAEREPRTDIFSSTGAYLGTLGRSVPFPAAFVDRDRFVAIAPDSSDLPVVTLYRLKR